MTEEDSCGRIPAEGAICRSVPDAWPKRQVKRLIKADKSQEIRGMDAKLEIAAKYETKSRSNGETEKLQAILSYYSENGSFPFSDFKYFHDFVMNSLQGEVSASEMMNQIEKMKQNYDKIIEKEVVNAEHKLNDCLEVTKLPGMILGNVPTYANDLKYTTLAVVLRRLKIDSKRCYNLLNNDQLEEFQRKWNELIWRPWKHSTREVYRLDMRALVSELLEALNSAEDRFQDS